MMVYKIEFYAYLLIKIIVFSSFRIKVRSGVGTESGFFSTKPDPDPRNKNVGSSSVDIMI